MTHSASKDLSIQNTELEHFIAMRPRHYIVQSIGFTVVEN